VILGGGFGGLYAARALGRAPVRVTLIDRRNHHLFQPLLYQVATAALNPSDIAAPIRRIVRRQRNATVMLAEAVTIDRWTKRVILADEAVSYDYLGLFAWILWLVVHIVWLIGFRNRFLVLSEWAWTYLRYERGARLITGEIGALLRPLTPGDGTHDE
jgi:NADH dehydrogenase FAD-containing subunit